jgi:hypothetical protein
MPLKLNIAMSRKVGEPNYGSRGATVGLEMEIDSNLVNQPQQLHKRIAHLFQLAKASIDHELGCRKQAPNSNSDLTAPGSEPKARPATANQLRAIHAIANGQNLNLTAALRSRFQVDRPDDLTLEQASQLIDALKTSTNGSAGRHQTA